MSIGDAIRLPAEWAPQFGVQLTWPHALSDWKDHLALVEPCFVNIAREISLREKVLIACSDPAHVQALLAQAQARMDRVVLVQAASNDTWARDHGPITVLEQGRPVLLDFTFNGWGLKYPAAQDNQLTRRLAAAGVFKHGAVRTLGFVLEGGAIESDGEGTLLTTAQCLLSANRNSHLSREAIEEALKNYFGARRILWLNHGYMAGDDTDSHIDTLARYCSPGTIAYVACEDPGDEHAVELRRMEEELRGFTTLEGRPYRLVKLPMPAAQNDDEGRRLPATYANFLILNQSVLVPLYNDAMDSVALGRIQSCFPGRSIVGIDCTSLILQHGSLHCVTMQFPEGVEF